MASTTSHRTHSRSPSPAAKRARSVADVAKVADVVAAAETSADISAPVVVSDVYASSRPYFCTADTLRATLETYGVAVVPNVLDVQEVGAMQDGAWQTMEHIGKHCSVPLKRTQPESWRSYMELLPMHSMLLQHHQVGHAQFIWDVRQNPKVAGMFASLWRCQPQDLLTSFDGMSFHFPPETTNRGYFRKSWMHTDQSTARNGFECVQSWVTAFDVRPGDATLSILVGSHKHHANLYTTGADGTGADGTGAGAVGTAPKDPKNDWYQLDSAQVQRLIGDLGCVEQHIVCPAGSMVLWDSRSVHCGRESLRHRETPNFRCVAYVCMLPRRCLNGKPDAILQKRRKAFEERRMTSHWPNKCKLFGKQPRTWGSVLPRVDPLPEPVLTKLGRSLVGY